MPSTAVRAGSWSLPLERANRPLPEMVKRLAHEANQLVRCRHLTAVSRTVKLVSTQPPTNMPPLPTAEAFIASLIARSEVQIPMIVSAFVYLRRLRSCLPPIAKAMRCSAHRIFLASLIVASKNLNDMGPKNKHWLQYAVVEGYDGFGFSLQDVNVMERQLLFLLDWNIHIAEEELLTHLQFLVPMSVRSQAPETEIRT
ncbi:hypothetical protein N7451_012392 [Penicillium sp. IBT 35674x]|nr:hypothetical protein N7451_012392 [Penicillium sp. IBT 35674x]